uniref:FBA domain-containing protein n=1 Tax=Panagrolaimus sp. ES5 TaxID=591445 RepID=A0AC34F5M3_9BILA
MEHFDRINNQTLDFQIKLMAIEEVKTHFTSSHEMRYDHLKSNMLADSNPNGRDSVSQKADYRWNFKGPGSKYQASITILDSSHRVIAGENIKKIYEQWQLQKWEKIEVKLQSYPSKARYIQIHSSGQDTQFWQGHYGVKIAGSELKMFLNDIPPVNLLNNTNLEGDDLTRYADSRWHFEGPWKYAVPVFLDVHYHPNFENTFEYCFETSYLECKKVLEVDLNKIGMSVVQNWEKVKLQIRAYSPGVRYIRVTSSGQDTQYWEGHYGVKIAGSELLVKIT